MGIGLVSIHACLEMGATGGSSNQAIKLLHPCAADGQASIALCVMVCTTERHMAWHGVAKTFVNEVSHMCASAPPTRHHRNHPQIHPKLAVCNNPPATVVLLTTTCCLQTQTHPGVCCSACYLNSRC